jgi:hypothetical protein
MTAWRGAEGHFNNINVQSEKNCGPEDHPNTSRGLINGSFKKGTVLTKDHSNRGHFKQGVAGKKSSKQGRIQARNWRKERSFRGIHARDGSNWGLLKQSRTVNWVATWSQPAQSLFSQAFPLKPAQQSQRILPWEKIYDKSARFADMWHFLICDWQTESL